MVFWKELLQKLNRTCQGRWALRTFLGFLFLSLLTPLLANDDPLVVVHEGRVFFPATEHISEKDLGGSLTIKADFRDPFFKEKVQDKGWILWSFIPYGADAVDYEFYSEGVSGPQQPSLRHFLGTDEQGRDLLARLLHALRFSFLFGLLVTGLSIFIGTSIGMIQGYKGGTLDLILQRVFEIWASIPGFLLMIILVSWAPSNGGVLLAGMIFIKSKSLIPLVRLMSLQARALPYVEAACVLGYRSWSLFFKHLLPNLLPLPIAKFPFKMAHALGLLTTLDFLGFSIPRSFLTFGTILLQGKQYLYAPWIICGALAFLVGMIASCLLLGNALNQILLNPETEREGV